MNTFNFDDVTNSPLYWPQGIERTPYNKRQRAQFHTRDRFGGASMRKRTIAESVRELEDEARRMGGRGLIVSSNLRVKNDGTPFSNQKAPDDPGVSVWFERKKTPLAFPCDKWTLVADNLWAIVLHLQSIRGQERWGVGSIDQAFAGYSQLPDPNERKWWEVLQVTSDANDETIKKSWRDLSKIYHPDNKATGNAILFDQVQKAYNLAMGRIK